MKGPEYWRIRLEAVTPESLAAHVKETGTPAVSNTSRPLYVLERRRRFLFWRYWRRAVSTLEFQEAHAWTVYFRISFP